MADRGWFARLTGRGAAPLAPGEPALLDGRAALARAAALTAEQVVTGGAAFGGGGDWHFDDAAAALAAARGLAATGRRATALVAPRRIETAAEQLAEAAARLEPLVAIVELPQAHEGGPQAAYHALASTGAFLSLADSLQQALDLAVVSRSVAELALVPGVVAVDPDLARSVQDLRLPPPETVRRFLGAPDELVEPPVPAQRMLFGEQRRRAVRWFDPDAPVGRGLLPGDAERAAILAGHRAFVTDRLPALADDALTAWSAATGRPLGLLSEHQLHGAEQVVVTQGFFVEPARAAASRLRRRDGLPAGVLGLTFLRPLPAEALRYALGEAKVVTVLESADDPLSGTTPLARELRSALHDRELRVLAAVGGLGAPPLGGAALEALFANMRSEAPRPIVYLGVAPLSTGTRFPKREALLQRIARECPEADRVTLPPAERAAGESGLRGVAYVARELLVPEGALETLAHAVSGAGTPHVRARSREAAPGVVLGRAFGGPEPFPEPGDDAEVGLLLVGAPDLPPGSEPLRLAARGATVVIAAREPAEAVWAALPASWADAVRERELSLRIWRGEPERLVEAAAPLLAGEMEGTEPLDWSQLEEPLREPSEPRLPQVVRRFRHLDTRHDNLPRFWSEQVEPSLAGGEPPVADPYLTAGSVPSHAAALADAEGRAASMPEIDPARCTGCGRCFTACPDGALAPVAAPVEALLAAAGAAAAAEGAFDAGSAGARRLARAHKPIAARLETALAKSGAHAFERTAITEAFEKVVAKIDLPEPEREEFTRAAKATEERFASWPLVAGDALFHAPHRQKKGSGRLLLIAPDARSCSGCGVCSAECPEEAIAQRPRDRERLAAAHEIFRAWESIPDTPGETIARAAEEEALGPLPAIHLSRHALSAVTGDAGHEAGSGGKLAVRLVLTVAESRRQQALGERIAELQEIDARLRERIKQAMTAPVEIDDIELLEQVLDGAPPRRAETRELLEKMERLGRHASTDVPRIKALVAAAREIGALRAALAEGRHGLGRARYGLVIADEETAGWAARFPRHPFGAPLVADLSERAVDLAAGLAAGLLERAVAEARAVRRAKLLAEAPADAARRLREIEALGWRDLAPAERALDPPVLLVARASGLSEGLLAGLSRVLASDLPLVVLLLDDRDLLAEAPDAALFALAHREAFVASTSPAAPRHLFDAVSDALDAWRPALVHLHAPSPARHGFPSERLLERARGAIACRVHPLLRYDPAGEGVFGLRLSLSGNPAVEAALPEAGPAPAEWCAGERRFAAELRDGKTPGPHLARALERRQEIWATLQELAGIVTPFTEAVRERAAQEVAEAHRAELAEVKKEYEAKLAELAATEEQRHRARLKERLLQLAGVARDGNGRLRP